MSAAIGAVVTMEDGGAATVVTRPIDVMLWEQGAKRKITDGMGMGDMMRVVYSAAKRDKVLGADQLSFDAWAPKILTFDPIKMVEDGEGGAVDPTHPAASDG